MREGEKWFYEISKVLSSYIDLDKVYYRGFENILIESRLFLCGMFEVDREVNFANVFDENLQNYNSDKILAVRYFNELNRYRNCIVVILH